MTDFENLIIREASNWLGTPYVHQASCRDVGTDCLGLIRGVYAELYGAAPTPPPYELLPAHGEGEVILEAATYYLNLLEDINPDNLRPGDVLLFRMCASFPARHLAILNPPHIIHAVENHRVQQTYLGRWWRRRLVAAFRFPPLEKQKIYD